MMSKVILKRVAYAPDDDPIVVFNQFISQKDNIE